MEGACVFRKVRCNNDVEGNHNKWGPDKVIKWLACANFSWTNCAYLYLQKELYVLVDKLRDIALDAEVTARLVSHGKDGRNERLATRRRQEDLDNIWTRYRTKIINGEDMLEELVQTLKINPRMSDADLEETVEYDTYEDA